MSTSAVSEDLRYPIGKANIEDKLSDAKRKELIAEIAATPQRLRKAVQGLNEKQLNTPYRPGGWTVKQTIHHVADSHMNAYIRFKLALTEDNPTIKAYDEAAWAKLADSEVTPAEVSLSLIDGVHQRQDALLRSFQPEDFQRKFTHPERGQMNVDQLICLYAWHGKHHTAHIEGLRRREGW